MNLFEKWGPLNGEHVTLTKWLGSKGTVNAPAVRAFRFYCGALPTSPVARCEWRLSSRRDSIVQVAACPNRARPGLRQL